MRTPRALVAVAVLAATVITTVLGLLTFGVQATVEPRGVPVAVAVPADVAPLRQAAQGIASQGGDAVSWRIVTPQQGRQLLDDKAVYGVLELTPGPQRPSATVVLSGAVNPSGTLVTQQLLSTVGQGVSGQPVTVQTVHPASAAARAVPLAASALLWIGCLLGSVLIVAVARRGGRRPSRSTRLATAFAVPVGVTAAVLGLVTLWDSGLRIDLRLIGFLLLAGLAFAAVQGGVLRLLGPAGVAILAPLYLIAPSVAGQVPELLHPAYRVLLWSWTPFRFSTEGVRSLLTMDTVAPDVRTALWVLGAMAVAGLTVLLWPGRQGPAAVDRVGKPVPAEVITA